MINRDERRREKHNKKIRKLRDRAKYDIIAAVFFLAFISVLFLIMLPHVPLRPWASARDFLADGR